MFGPFGMAAAMYAVYKIGIYRFELNEDISQITVKKNNAICSIDWNYVLHILKKMHLFS